MSEADRLERDLVKCEDIRIHAQRATDFIGARSLQDFRADRMLQDAVIRCLEVVGEAARLVSDDTRARAAGIPWSLITGLRNVLAHEYGTVDLDNVYRVVKEDLPGLLAEVSVLISALEKDVGWPDS